jgi:hypothetical protein
MMKRINRNKTFLYELAKGNLRKRCQLIKNCTEEELRALIELVINNKLFQFNSKEKVTVRAAQPLIKYLAKSKVVTSKFKTLLIKYNQVLAKLTAIILLKITEEAITCVLLS